jgi:two-component sensor histidine kinase
MKRKIESARYVVTHNVIVFTFFLMALLSIFNYFFNSENFIITSLAAVAALMEILSLSSSKKYKRLAFITIFIAYLLNFYNLLGESDYEKYIDLFWIINFILFAFFTLGRKTGVIYLVVNILTVTSISFLDKLEIIELRPRNEVLSYSFYFEFGLNMLVCTLFFAYLINQFLKQLEIADEECSSFNNELKKLNNELQMHLNEKSLMLKEIHHRVKNNLQIITSLLRLQLYKLDDEKTRSPFEESINRINAMALIHEKMYQGDKVGKVHLETYIRDLANNLISNYANIKVDIQTHTEIETLDLDVIIPFSLILNELVANSLKHAFKDEKNNRIKIEIKKKDNLIIFEYCDNGNWKMPDTPNSFGIEMINTFTEQLGGNYTIDHTNGTKYKFVFELLPNH